MFKGTVIAQIIGAIGSLFLAKLYAPELYGYYSVFISITGILSIFNSFKLEYILITEKSNKRSFNLVNTLLLIISIASILHIILLGFSKEFIINKGITTTILVLSIITAFFTSNTKVLESLATRKSFFKIIANAKILTTSCTIFFQLLLFYNLKDNGLLYGYLASTIIVFLYFLFTTQNKSRFPNLQLAKTTIQSHLNILKFGFPSGLINTIALNIMPVFMLSYFSSSTAGVYALSLKIVSIPMLVISASVSQVYFQKASRIYNYDKTKLFDFTKKIVFSNIIIIIIILILINTIGIYLLTILFDTDWVNLRYYIFLLSFLILGKISFSPISFIIVICNKMHIGLIFNTILLSINIISIYIGSLYNDIILTIKILSFIGGGSYFVLLIYFLSLLKSYKNEN